METVNKIHIEIKKLVVKEMETWPKNINPPDLLKRLDNFAARVIETQKIIDVNKELNDKKI